MIIKSRIRRYVICRPPTMGNFKYFEFFNSWLPIYLGRQKKIFILADGRLFQSQKKNHQYFKRAVVIELTAVCNWYAIHKSRHQKSYTAGVLHDFAISIQIQWHSFLYICPIHLSYLYKISYSIVKLILARSTFKHTHKLLATYSL